MTVTRAELIEAGCRGLIDSMTNGLCGSSWPGPCDMCDCGLDGMTVTEAAAGFSAAQDRMRVAEVLRRGCSR